MYGARGPDEKLMRPRATYTRNYKPFICTSGHLARLSIGQELDTHLNPCLSQVGLHGDLFPRVDVRVVGLLEGALEFFELGGCESRPNPALLPLLSQHSVVVTRRMVTVHWGGGGRRAVVANVGMM